MVGMSEAKTHLSRLVTAVTRGDTVVISRHGVPAVQLAPLAPDSLSRREKPAARGNPPNPEKALELLTEIAGIVKTIDVSESMDRTILLSELERRHA
jgi:prevent-host-death family protein